MLHLSSASLAANYGPPASSSASMVSALSVLIPVLVVGILLAASPQVRAQLARSRKEIREFLYGPQKNPEGKPKKASPSAASAAQGADTPESPTVPTDKPEILSFDHSIFNEDEE